MTYATGVISVWAKWTRFVRFAFLPRERARRYVNDEAFASMNGFTGTHSSGTVILVLATINPRAP